MVSGGRGDLANLLTTTVDSHWLRAAWLSHSLRLQPLRRSPRHHLRLPRRLQLPGRSGHNLATSTPAGDAPHHRHRHHPCQKNNHNHHPSQLASPGSGEGGCIPVLSGGGPITYPSKSQTVGRLRALGRSLRTASLEHLARSVLVRWFTKGRILG